MFRFMATLRIQRAPARSSEGNPYIV
jgi:hypothetical protein